MSVADQIRANAAEVDDLLEQLAETEDKLAVAVAKNVQDGDTINALTSERDNLQQELAECQDATPDPTPEPPKPMVTDFGSCPPQGGSAAGTITKWGKGSALRVFSPGAFTTPTPPADSGTYHHLWKPALGSPINAANVTAAVKNLRAGDVVEVWHEADVKYRKGDWTPAQAQQVVDMKNTFYDVVKSVRPDLKVATTYAAWMFDDSMYPGAASDPTKAEFWAKVKADFVGIDCDGVANLTKYPDFTDPIKNVKDYIVKHPATYKGWSVPEFAHPRISTDTNGSVRAAWMTDWGNKFKAAGAVYVDWFDYNTRPNVEVPVPSPEYTAWKAFI